VTAELMEKVTALITRPGAGGPELIVFDHGVAGVQLPAGTVEGQAAAIRPLSPSTSTRPFTREPYASRPPPQPSRMRPSRVVRK